MIPLDQNTQSWRRYRWPTVIAIFAIFVSMMTLDRYTNVFAIESKMPGDLRAFFQCVSFFGHGTGCLIAVLLIWSLDRKNKAAIPLIIGSAQLAGAISSAIKVIIHRPRPFVDQSALSDSVTWSEAVFHNFLQSFPSGHTATAFALAMALSLSYRQGKPLFLSFAVLVGIQRIISQNHYPSDVIAGALVGVTSAQMILLLMHRPLRTLATGAGKSKGNTKPQNSGHQPSVSGITPV